LDLLIFPLNPRGTEHWWSVVFDFTAHTITTHNSSPAPPRNTTKYTRALKILVAELFTTYHHPIWTWATWTTIGPESSPKQTNAYDCGVFLCMTITHLAMRSPLTFTQQDMPHYRQHIARRILANTYCRVDAGEHTHLSEDNDGSTPAERPLTPTSPGLTPQVATQCATPTRDPQYDSQQQPKLKPLPTQTPTKQTKQSKQQRRRQKHAVTHRPLSPILPGPLPSSPQAAATTHSHYQRNPTDPPPTPHTPPHGGDCVGGPACSPTRENRLTVREEGRETTATNPTDLANLYANSVDEPSSPTASSAAAAYTRRHTHPG